MTEKRHYMPSAKGARQQPRGSGVSASSPIIFMPFKSNFGHFETRFIEKKKKKLIYWCIS